MSKHTFVGNFKHWGSPIFITYGNEPQIIYGNPYSCIFSIIVRPIDAMSGSNEVRKIIIEFRYKEKYWDFGIGYRYKIR